MSLAMPWRAQPSVALLAEGVDRNARSLVILRNAQVALLAEGVDRNNDEKMHYCVNGGRPPRGGRG